MIKTRLYSLGLQPLSTMTAQSDATRTPTAITSSISLEISVNAPSPRSNLVLALTVGRKPASNQPIKKSAYWIVKVLFSGSITLLPSWMSFFNVESTFLLKQFLRRRSNSKKEKLMPKVVPPPLGPVLRPILSIKCLFTLFTFSDPPSSRTQD